MDFKNEHLEEIISLLSTDEKYLIEDVINCIFLEKMSDSNEFISKLAKLLNEV